MLELKFKLRTVSEIKETWLLNQLNFLNVYIFVYMCHILWVLWATDLKRCFFQTDTYFWYIE